MKKIFITINDGSIARNILHSFVLEKILERKDVVVGLIVPSEKGTFYEREFGSPRIEIFPCRRGPPTFFERLLSFLARNGIDTKTTRTDQRTQLLVDKKRFWFLFKKLFTFVCGRSALFHRFVRFLAVFRKPSASMREIFERGSPSLLFSADVQSELDLDAMASARVYKVKIAGMVRSWDNLSSRSGLVEILPDLLLVWNPYLYEQTRTIQHIPQNRVRVVGIPQYDLFLQKDTIWPRKEFLARFGISFEKRVIIFAGIGNFLAPHEPEVVEILSAAEKSGEIKSDVAIIFRPHPHFLTERERILIFGNVIFDDGVALYTGDNRSSWEMDREKTAHLANSLYHADLVITTASTITMDAAVFDRPVVCIAFDGNSRVEYWNSVRRYYENYTHYFDLSATKGFKIAYNAEEFIRAINQYLENPKEDEAGRQNIRDHFIGRLDGRSSERIANVILSAL